MNSVNPPYMITILCLVLVVVLLAGCPEATPEAEQDGPGAQNLQMEGEIPRDFEWAVEENFKLLVPKNWQRTTDGALFISASQQESQQDTFRENVIVLLESAPIDKDMQSYFEESITELAAELDSFALKKVEKTTLAAEPALLAEYKASVDGVPIHYHQLFTLKNNTIYILAIAVAEDDLARRQETISIMKESFTITGELPNNSTKENASDTEPSEPKTQQVVKVPAHPELVRKWRLYSEGAYYDSGEINILDRPPASYLELKEDSTWQFRGATGTWEVQDISEDDWASWGVNSFGPTRKIVLYGWNNDRVDGPIEESGGRADFIWVIYRAGPPEVKSLAQIQMKFGWVYRDIESTGEE